MSDSWGGSYGNDKNPFSPSYQGGAAVKDSNPFSASNQKQGGARAYTDDEYAEAHQQVYDNITRMTQNFQEVSKMAQALGTPKDSQRLRQQLAKLVEDTHALVRQTRSTITDMGALIQSSQNQSHKAERRAKVEKLSSDFGRFTDKFDQLVRIAEAKQREQPLPSAPARGNGAKRPVEDPLDNAFLEVTKSDRQQQLEDEREFQDALIRERDEEIRTIQSQMIEVNDVFRDLARLVEDQGEMVDNIQSNIISASQNVTAAHEEIEKASEYQDTGRRRLCFIAIGVVVIVGIAVLLVILLSPPAKKH